jgi:hypothetical protein
MGKSSRKHSSVMYGGVHLEFVMYLVRVCVCVCVCVKGTISAHNLP